MKIGELIKTLQSFPAAAPVVAAWEGGWSNLEMPELQKDRKGCDVLVFDVDDYGTYNQDSLH